MTNFATHLSEGLKSLAFTSLFCLVIAFATHTIWLSPLWEHILISFGYGYSAIFIAYLLQWSSRQWTKRQISVISIGSSMALGTANAYYWLSKYEKFSNFSQMKPVIILGFIFLAACFLYFYTYKQKLLTQKELERAKRIQAEQEKALLFSQLKQLQSQIEPHFLFNTLANINALIDSDAKNAKLMLGKLTELLRERLKQSRQHNSTLEGELELVDAYLAIQKIRLGERLKYEIINHCSENFNIPPLLVQPLVENAVQHGIEPSSAGGWIRVEASEAKEQVSIKVLDDGIGFGHADAHPGQGIGLENIRQRLNTLFGGNALMSLKKSLTGGVVAQVTILRTSLESLEVKMDAN
ncbi:histidine kinase [uncultured Microbulbifer sp.]|uniref:sensor histidine kinase n=1 Tax=uncultured Microbulbifer sp. TaxID=348147 RepID=UPI0026265F59|nr:histidine kinase [uncultured Microbulbifer sp.]